MRKAALCLSILPLASSPLAAAPASGQRDHTLLHG
jgi:hypothetical protein